MCLILSEPWERSFIHSSPQPPSATVCSVCWSNKLTSHKLALSAPLRCYALSAPPIHCRLLECQSQMHMDSRDGAACPMRDDHHLDGPGTLCKHQHIHTLANWQLQSRAIETSLMAVASAPNAPTRCHRAPSHESHKGEKPPTLAARTVSSEDTL